MALSEENSPAGKVFLRDLGLIDYMSAWKTQEKYFEASVNRKLEIKKNPYLSLPNNYLLLCEHPPVYTLGKSGSEEHLLLNREELLNRSIDLIHNNRGGDITYHGPGQVVGYPIIDLDQFNADIKAYMRSLEEVLIRTIAEYGLKGERIDDATGVWLDVDKGPLARKICALGVKTSRWVTMHGFAINVNTDLSYFNYIVPCGIADKGVTSMEKELGRPVDLEKVKARILHYFREVFNVEYSEDFPQI
ncbi:MAG: lipoyl(octanoyl) transferase LipB [Bacteroidetes bacterium]|nr:lipoyl(octanoyl) transferase LipB [Bacteroidota bacterium]